MLLNEDAFDELVSRLDDFEEGRSSHWQHEQNQFSYDQESFHDVGPMGTFSTASGIVPTVAHFVFQLPFRLLGVTFSRFFSIDRAARAVAKRQNRQYDLDLLRHVLTLAFLQTKLKSEIQDGPVCIIGDGYGNMASVILAALPTTPVVLVNLNKSLLVDLICLRKAFPGIDYAYVRSRSELDEALASGIKIIGVSANDASLLRGARFGLAINIESMMEMDPEIIENYFDILRSGPDEYTVFYCCNQESKEFSGQGRSNFHEYPWKNEDDILVDGVCSWTRFRYGNTFPFYARRRPDLHRLVRLKTRS